MKIKTSTSQLSTCLEIVEKALPVRTTTPVINNILLEIKHNDLVFSATNHEIFINASLNHESDVTGKILLPPKVVDIIRYFPTDEVEIDINSENYRLDIRGGTAHFNLFGSSYEDFPVTAFLNQGNPPEKFNIELIKLKKTLKEVIFAASTEETRPAFNGILLNFSGNKLVLTSSDTYRLVVSEITDSSWSFKESRCLVPAKALREFLRILDESHIEATIGYKDTYFSISYGNIFFASRLLEEKYPDVSGVIPQAYETRVVIDKKSLENTISRASLLAQGKNQAVNVIAREGQFEVKVSSQEGSMEEVIPVDYEGEDVDLFVNSRFVLDILKIIDSDKIIIEFHGDGGPIVFKLEENNAYLYLVLPIKKVN